MTSTKRPTMPGIVAEDCRCACHIRPGMIHSVPCCETCAGCGKRIRVAWWKGHREACAGRGGYGDATTGGEQG